jgi:hypothetical protein
VVDKDSRIFTRKLMHVKSYNVITKAWDYKYLMFHKKGVDEKINSKNNGKIFEIGKNLFAIDFCVIFKIQCSLRF